MNRSIALVALLVFAPLAARADTPADPVSTPQTPPPESFSALRWGEKDGFWFSQDQVVRINGRIDYLEKKAAKECVDAQVTADTAKIPGWVWMVAGVLVGGAAGYFGSRAIKK